MKTIEEFLGELAGRQSSSSATSNFCKSSTQNPTLPPAVSQAASRGWQIFPMSPLAKLTGNPDLLIGEATSDISRLEAWAVEYPGSNWRVAAGPSSLCILQLDGQRGRESFRALNREQGDCLTLQAQRVDAGWAFFRWPGGLVLRSCARKLAAGVGMLGLGDSCAIPPSGGSFYINPWAEIESVPCWLRELAFESPNSSPANAAAVPTSTPCPVTCRSRTPFIRSYGSTRKTHSVRGQAGWHSGFRIRRRR